MNGFTPYMFQEIAKAFTEYESNNNDVEYISDNEYYTSSDSDNDDEDID